jgi:hypothetical protein
MIGGSVWLAEKNKTSMRKKNPVKPMPACKNLFVQVKIQAGL